MFHNLYAKFLAGLLILTLIQLFSVTPASAVTDEEVGQSIDKLVEYLLSKQEKNGRFPYKQDSRGYQSGHTALVVTALLYSGMSPQHPQIQKALNYLQNDEEGSKLIDVYQTGLHAHVWARLPDDLAQPENHGGPLRTVFYWLENNHNEDYGTFAYEGDKKHGDHSCSQYGLLGLWECSKRGLSLSQDYWKKSIVYWTTVQNQDGSWGYKVSFDKKTNEWSSDKGRSTMTLAGLTALMVAQQEHLRDSSMPDKRVTDAIGKGLDWMNEKGSSAASGGYHAVGMERVALASGVKYFRGKDWFADGASDIIEKINKKKLLDAKKTSGFQDQAFYLMFLSRGRVPVWISKVIVPGIATNNRPNDLYFLSRAISDLREREVNFFTVSIDHSAEELLDTPMLYLASAQPIKLEDKHQKTLKRYLDMGGLLVCNPDENSPSFKISIESLANEMYPDLEWKVAGPKHPLYNALREVNASQASIKVLNNGARDLIVLFNEDYGMRWQADRDLIPTDANQRTASEAGKIGANLFVWATDRGVLPNRLEARFEKRQKGIKKSGDFTVGLASVKGKPHPEPAVWERASNHIFNHTGIEVETQSPVALDKLGDAKFSLLHLAGTGKVTLSEAELKGINAFIEKGGTIFIENIGGDPKAEFSESVAAQLEQYYAAGFIPLRPGDELIKSEDANANSYDLTDVTYRRYATVTFNFKTEPRLSGLYVNGYFPIIISHEDVSLGALHLRRWGIVGYAPESAEKILNNLVLYAQNRQKQVDKDIAERVRSENQNN